MGSKKFWNTKERAMAPKVCRCGACGTKIKNAKYSYNFYDAGPYCSNCYEEMRYYESERKMWQDLLDS